MVGVVNDMNVETLSRPVVLAFSNEFQKGKRTEPQDPTSTARALASNTYFVVQ